MGMKTITSEVRYFTSQIQKKGVQIFVGTTVEEVHQQLTFFETFKNIDR